jgi:copper chaperone CopZ
VSGAAGDIGGMKGATMSTITILVREIHCGGCEKTIRIALSRVEGVCGVQPDHRTNRVRISFDEARVSDAGLREVLAGLGFEPSAG